MRNILLLAALGGLSACQATAPGGDSFTSVIDPVTTSGASGVQVTRGFGPPDADPASCYGREVDPAVIETVTEQILVEPEQLDRNGNIRRPAVFVTATEQRIVEDRTETWFETPCAMEGNADYIATLQRALAARGHYTGPVTGRMDRATVQAVRAYQQPQGLDSGVLSLAAARQLGLSVWDPELAAGTSTDG
ncbi:peptidoglycan-binding domain-containing protein [Hasllibacter sp. MH4015]|uniref:peptidoglycan-binding domain-containing protein n=1 Tax=Hasllibacter sp. MH4015 TaxID=2854029 RepID=UPI001CD4F1F1|nr:peptidoglycan-binding domain-containing protein [Hasllibacter sp. MH4015]